MLYIALMRKDEDSDYGVDFPDFPGCVTAGLNLDEAKDMAIEALNFHVEGMIKEGLPIPGPAELSTIMADPLNRDAYAFLVDVPTKKEKAVRVNFSILESVLRRIDATATSLGLTRSAFLAASAMEKVKEHEEAAGATGRR